MKKIILTLSIMLLSYFGYGQHIGQYYTLLESTATYESLTNANNIYYGQDIDDGQFQINIPFTFNYNGDHYTSLYIGINGAISFSSSTVFYGNHLESTNSRDDNIVAPLWDDMYIRSADGGYVAYKTIGSSPHRRFAIEWVNVSWRNAGSTVTFKMELEEGSNNIYFYYGPNNSTETRSASIGMKFDRYIDNTHNFLSLTPTVPASVSYTTANNSISTSAYPGEGRIYAFKHKTYVPDFQLESKIETYSSASDGTYHNGYVLTRGLLGFYTTDFSNLNIADATGVEDMKNLQQAKFAHNQLSAIQFYQYNTALTHVDISYNQFTQAPDLSNYATQIIELKYNDNQLDALDVNALTSLTRLWCNDNQLESLKVQNGNNTNFTEFHASGNPLLGCIEVDNPTYSQANWTDIDNGAGFSTDCHYGETYVPDTNFEHYLETHTINHSGQISSVSVGDPDSMGNGIDGDHYVTTANIQHTYNTKLDMDGLNISDLTGIEDFIYLRELNVNDNNIVSVNLSQNTALESLEIARNQVTSINLNHNTALTVLDLGSNQLSTLDLSANTALQSVAVGDNQINSLDVSMLPDLTSLNCTNNQLVTLDVRNGHNASMQHFYATVNSNLTCIYVDDPSASYLSGWSIDSTSHFVADETECANTYYTYVPDDHFENYLETHDASGSLVAVGDSNSLGNGLNGDDYVLTSRINSLTNLDVHRRNIADLTGIEDFVALQNLNFSQNTLTSVNLSTLTQLTHLTCNQNHLTSIDVSNNHALININCSDNQLTNLDLSNQDDIESIACSNNQITQLIISEGYYGQSDLMYLFCDHNQLTALDLSGLETLEEIECQNNQLEALNVANGNYNNFGNLNFTNNPNLTCIEVDDVSYMNNHWSSAKDPGASYSTACHYNETYVPDDNFEYYLETHTASGSTVPIGNANSMGNGSMDDYVTTANIENVTYLNVYNQNISDLTGIEDFTALQTLNVRSNQLTSLNVTNNTNLLHLYCYQNQLTGLNITGLNSLQTIWAHLNQLTTLDISQNTALKSLYVGNNQLANLDVSNNPALETLYCYSNHLTSLDVSQNSNLKKLWTQFNQLTSLDVDANPLLEQLWCQNNQLTELHIQNGANNLLSGTITSGGNTYARMRATGNPNLTCIYVNDATSANNGTGDYADWEKDEHANYVADATQCTNLSRQTYVPDDNFESYLETNGMGDGIANNNYVYTANIENVTNLNIRIQYISDLTGIEDFTALDHLDVGYNQLTNLDLSQNTNLTHLSCDSNQLTSLNINNNPNLVYLLCNNNNLTSLDVSNSNLDYIDCRNNALSSIDVSSLSGLMRLYIADNQLTGLDVSQNPNLTTLWCQNNQLTDLNVKNGHNTAIPNGGFNATGNPNLTCIQVDDATWSTNNWTQIDATASFSEDCSIVYYNLIVNTTGNGSVSPSNGTYADGTVVTLTATPDAGWEFAGWSGDLTGINNPATITMDADKTVTATFTRIQHTLTVNHTGNGSVSMSPAGGTYDEGTTVTLTATPDAGWEFAGWSGDLTGTNNPATITMDADKTVTATFTRIQHTLTVNHTGNGSVSLSPAGGTYNEGTTVTLTATPDAGWEFAGWSGDLTGTNNPATITMDADKTVTATFTRIQHTLTVNTTGNGSVSLSPAGGTYDEGTTVTLTATPDAGWEFAGWSGDLTGTNNPATITMDADKTVMAMFTQLAQTYVPDDNFEHYLEHHDASGNVVALGAVNSMGNGVENDNYVLTSRVSTVTYLRIYNQNIADLTGIQDFTALTNIYCNGNNITSVDFSHNTNLILIDMGYNQISSIDLSSNTALETLSASFNQLTDLDVSMLPNFISLDVSRNNLTSLNVKNGNNTNFTRFNATGNSNLTCIQVDDATWSTTHWTQIDATASFNEDCSIVYYSLTVHTTGNGSVSPSSGTYADGTVVNLTATPDAGWEFAGWSGDLTGTNNPATITMDTDKTITATFTRIQHTLTVNHTGNGSVSMSPVGGTYDEGTTVTLTATPDTGWEFTGWSGDLTGTNNPATITMDADKTVTAVFNQLAQTYVPDDNFEAYLEANGMGNGVANDDYVTTNNINTVTNLDVSSQSIADMTGIQDFTALQILACYNNQLTTLDVSQNTALSILSCHTNQLITLDFNNNLRTLNCSFNQLTNLDVSGNTTMIWLKCANNQLAGLDVRNGNNTNFTYFNAQNNPDLTCIFVDDPAWSNTNWTNIDATSHFVANQTECDNVGIDDEAMKLMLKVYPNPVKDELMVQSETYQDLEVHVYSLIGQELAHQKSNNGNMIVNLKSLPAATYVVKISIDGRSVYYNVIKE